MRKVFLALFCAALASSAASSRAKSEEYFVPIPYGPGIVLTFKINNPNRSSAVAVAQFYSEAGKLLGERPLSLPAGNTSSLRMDMGSRNGAGWVRIASNFPGVTATITTEMMEGNELTTLPDETAWHVFPENENDVRSASLSGIRPRYTYDGVRIGVADRFYFLNLSAYPVHVSICQSTYPDCVPLGSGKTVDSLQMIYYDLDRKKPYFVSESDPGFFIGAPIRFASGMKKVFKTDTSISFGTPVDDATVKSEERSLTSDKDRMPVVVKSSNPLETNTPDVSDLALPVGAQGFQPPQSGGHSADIGPSFEVRTTAGTDFTLRNVGIQYKSSVPFFKSVIDNRSSEGWVEVFFEISGTVSCDGNTASVSVEVSAGNLKPGDNPVSDALVLAMRTLRGCPFTPVTARFLRGQPESVRKRQDHETFVKSLNDEMQAREAERQKELRFKQECDRFYEKASNRKISDLTVGETRQLRACQAKGY